MAVDREPVSAFIISMNEEDQIAECIESVKFCDEIVVVDSFSTDRTVEIARALGARVVQHAWSGYVKQKDFALSQTAHEWVINLDADERVSPELRRNIESVLTMVRRDGADSAPSGYFLNRVVFHLGRWWRKGGWYPEYRLRFFRRSQVTWGGVEPHEKPIPLGATARLPGELLHFTYENFGHQIDRLHHLSAIAAKGDYDRGKRANVLSLVFNPILRTLKFYIFKRGYREGVAGFIVAVTEGYYTFLKYAQLWEYQAFPSQGTLAERRRLAIQEVQDRQQKAGGE